MTTPVTVLGPCFNEFEVVDRFVTATLGSMEEGWELLLVDDGSTDGTGAELARLAATHPRVHVVTHEVNRGLGAALRTGFDHAAGDVIVTIDADLSHPLALLPSLVLGCHAADAVYASRFVPGGSMETVPWARRSVSSIGNSVLRALLRVPVRDMTTGYRAYRAEAIKALPLRAEGFEIQLEITVLLCRAGASVLEIPFELGTRAAGQSKMKYGRLARAYGRTVGRLLVTPRRKGVEAPALSEPPHATRGD